MIPVHLLLTGHTLWVDFAQTGLFLPFPQYQQIENPEWYRVVVFAIPPEILEAVKNVKAVDHAKATACRGEKWRMGP